VRWLAPFLACFVVAAAAGTARAAASPRAAGWTHISDSPQSLVAFYARLPGRPSGVRRKVELLYDYASTQEDPDTLKRHRSAVVSAVVDCRAQSISMGGMVTYEDPMGRGAKVEQTRPPERTFRHAEPGTIDREVVRFACALR